MLKGLGNILIMFAVLGMMGSGLITIDIAGVADFGRKTLIFLLSGGNSTESLNQSSSSGQPYEME